MEECDQSENDRAGKRSCKRIPISSVFTGEDGKEEGLRCKNDPAIRITGKSGEYAERERLGDELGHPQSDLGAFAKLRFDLYRTQVHFHDFLHQAHAETGAWDLARGVGAVETFKQP